MSEVLYGLQCGICRSTRIIGYAFFNESQKLASNSSKIPLNNVRFGGYRFALNPNIRHHKMFFAYPKASESFDRMFRKIGSYSSFKEQDFGFSKRVKTAEIDRCLTVCARLGEIRITQVF